MVVVVDGPGSAGGATVQGQPADRSLHKERTEIRFRHYTNKSRNPAAPATNARETPTLPAEPVCTLDEEVSVEVACCDPTNGVFIFDALAVSVDTGPDVVALDPSLAVAPAVVPATDPVDAAVSVTAAAADSAFVPVVPGLLVVVVIIPVPVVPVADAAAVAAESVTSVIDAAVSVAAEAELLIFSASVCVRSNAFAFGASEPPDSGNRPV